MRTRLASISIAACLVTCTGAALTSRYAVKRMREAEAVAAEAVKAQEAATDNAQAWSETTDKAIEQLDSCVDALETVKALCEAKR